MTESPAVSAKEIIPVLIAKVSYREVITSFTVSKNSGKMKG
jgi:hypothetical protein